MIGATSKRSHGLEPEVVETKRDPVVEQRDAVSCDIDRSHQRPGRFGRGVRNHGVRERGFGREERGRSVDTWRAT